jgi:hypothetical protein
VSAFLQGSGGSRDADDRVARANAEKDIFGRVNEDVAAGPAQLFSRVLADRYKTLWET